MKTSPMLEEPWKVKDDLATEAGYGVERALENLRQWEREHPHSGRVVHCAAELRQLADEEERKLAGASQTALRDKPRREG